ncbi:MAG: thioredoxin [Pseudomonadota bacterium]
MTHKDQATPAGAAVTTLAPAQFEETITAASVPVLVDFMADWCGPCRTQAPLLESFARNHQGSVQVHKVDVDQASAIASRLGVRSIPTLMLFAGGAPVASRVGVQSASALEALLAEAQSASES